MRRDFFGGEKNWPKNSENCCCVALTAGLLPSSANTTLPTATYTLKKALAVGCEITTGTSAEWVRREVLPTENRVPRISNRYHNNRIVPDIVKPCPTAVDATNVRSQRQSKAHPVPSVAPIRPLCQVTAVIKDSTQFIRSTRRRNGHFKMDIVDHVHVTCVFPRNFHSQQVV